MNYICIFRTKLNPAPTATPPFPTKNFIRDYTLSRKRRYTIQRTRGFMLQNLPCTCYTRQFVNTTKRKFHWLLNSGKWREGASDDT